MDLWFLSEGNENAFGKEEKDMERKTDSKIGWMIILIMFFAISNIYARDITDAAGLRSFLGAEGSGDNVILTKDVELTETIKIKSGNIVLDLHGKSIYNKWGSWNITGSNRKKIDIFDIEGGSLTIQGSGSVYNQETDGNSTIWVTDGTLNIETTIYSKKHEAITLTGSGTVNVKPGAMIYSENSNKKSLNVTSGSVKLTGGTIKNTGGGISISAYKNISSFLPEGYGIYKDGNLQNAEVTQMYGELNVKPIEYKLSYNTNGGEVIIDGSYTVENYITLPTPVRKGYYFVGWTKDNSPISSLEGLTGDISLEATWKPINYTLNFNTKGGTQVSTIKYTINDSPSFPDSPTKNGYNFSSWHLKEDTSDEGLSSVPFLGGSKEEVSITVYAKWTPEIYSITYVENGGRFSGDEIVKEYTVETPTFNLPEPIKNDNTFKGWYLKNDLTGDRYEKISQGTTGNKTFYAKWLQTYYLTCHWHDGSVKYPYTKEDKVYIFPSDIKRKGYELIGWLDNSSGQGTPVLSVSIDKIGSDYYAQWSIIHYKLNYNLNGGINPEGAKFTYTINDNIVLPTPTKVGADFVGWFKDKTLSEAITSIQTGSVGDVSLYAKWNLTTYTIKLDTKGGSSLGDVSYTIDTDNLALSKKSRKNGYNFVGWYKDEDCTQPFGETILKNTSGNFTLYAKWEPIEYIIEYETYSDVKVPSSTYTIEQEILLPTPQRDAYTFAGWYESDRLEGDAILTIAEETTGNKKLYAKWASGSRLIISQAANGTFTVKNGDKEIKSGEYVGPKTVLTLTATPMPPYTLSKWVLDGKEAGSDNPTTVEMPAANGLAVSAIFVDDRTAATAPEIITDPVNTEKVPKGESVKVKLTNKDDSATLYYSVDGAPDKAYTGEFFVASARDTLVIKAIARKSGFKDGVTTRQVIFDNSKITLTFDLPLGVKAINPTGGDVVTATTTGGSFEFKLTVDRDYYTNLDSMVVSANDSIIQANASGLYTLTDCVSDVIITVSGLKAKVCTVTLQQTENGQISFTDGAEETTAEVEYGASVSITAKADEDFKFLQWNTGSQSNPLKLTVKKDTTISARFISDYKAYAVTLPQLEGVKVKPFTGYSTEVKKDGTFKFYLQLAAGYREENLVVRANGEELVKNKGGYAIFHINKNISISVEGIVREPVALEVPENVQAKVIETMADPSVEGVYGETMILLHAEAPAGKTFSKWTDGKTDNPRLSTAQDASQLHPLFVDKEDEDYAKVTLNQSPGAGITAVNANIDGLKKGETVQLKVVLLPAYSQSEVKLTVDDQVMKPDISLRAASETKTYVFLIPVNKDDVAVKVSGMKRNIYEVSVAQTNGGAVSATPLGEITHGDTVRLQAQPESGMLFVKWWDGNTLNPYPYAVTSDTEVKAYFVGTESTVDNESICKEDQAEITTDGNRLFIRVDKESQGYIFNFRGGLYKKLKIPAGGYSMYLPDGEYVIRVGENMVRKVIVR